MKKSIGQRTAFTLFLLALIAFGSDGQTIRRVNNDPLVALGLNMYRTVQAAHDAAVVNDIIYIEPQTYTSLSIGSLICTKTLRFIGNGYNHTQNTNIVQPFIKDASGILSVTVQNTAPQTSFEGITFTTGNLIIEATNVKITRCNFGNMSISLIRDQNGKNGSSAEFTRNLFNYSFGGFSATGYSITDINNVVTLYQISNVSILNNIFVGGLTINSLFSNSYIYPSWNNLIVKNNSIETYIYGSNFQNGVFQSNIIRYGFNSASTLSTFGNVASNNVCSLICGFGTNNIENVPYASIYNTTNQVAENVYILSATSPAIGAGLGGVDAGAFGTNNPYRLSGLAPIPQITAYSKNASSGVYTATTPMTVTISVRGNN